MLFKYLLFFLAPFVCFATPFGKDADLVKPTKPMTKLKQIEEKDRIEGMGVSLSRALIRFHHEVITPIDGPRSHFLPSSSQYTLDGIEKYGFIDGWILGCDRLLRENDDPWIYPTCLNPKGERFKRNPVR